VYELAIGAEVGNFFGDFELEPVIVARQKPGFVRFLNLLKYIGQLAQAHLGQGRVFGGEQAQLFQGAVQVGVGNGLEQVVDAGDLKARMAYWS
jgi:hypothetical protein